MIFTLKIKAEYVDETSSAKQIAAVKISTSFLNLTKTNLRPAVLRLGVLPDDPRPGGPSAGGQKTAGRATTGGVALVAASQVGTNRRLSGGGDQPGEDDRDDPTTLEIFLGGILPFGNQTWQWEIPYKWTFNWENYL